MGNAFYALNSSKKISFPKNFKEISLSDIPQIRCWPKDGGAFITLPQVYSEDINKPGISNSNLGMYRIQISGNKYVKDKEVGVHYQIHRGIGIHQKNALKKKSTIKSFNFCWRSTCTFFFCCNASARKNV